VLLLVRSSESKGDATRHWDESRVCDANLFRTCALPLGPRGELGLILKSDSLSELIVTLPDEACQYRSTRRKQRGSRPLVRQNATIGNR
jgi:hypothetical protein